MKKCLTCKKQFKVWPYETETRKFCSHRCYWAYQTGQIRTYNPVIKDKFYRTWRGIQNRCYNRKENSYSKYGGRGIKCLWKSLTEFRDDMYQSYQQHILKFGEKNTSIDRIDNNGNYCKKNCRWATMKEQASNRNSRIEITYNNQTMSITEWAEFLNIPKVALWLRIFRYKWPIEKAFTKKIILRKI